MRAAPSGCRLRVCFRPFAVCNRRKSSGIDRGYADSVVVHEYGVSNAYSIISGIDLGDLLASTILGLNNWYNAEQRANRYFGLYA